MSDLRPEFSQLFEALRALYLGHQPAGVLLRDEPGNYSLATHGVREKDGYRTWFGGAEIRKNYVSAHVMPVYIYPELLDGISPALRKRMQGKACFNFKTADDALFAELGGLIARGAARFEEDGRLNRPV